MPHEVIAMEQLLEGNRVENGSQNNQCPTESAEGDDVSLQAARGRISPMHVVQPLLTNPSDDDRFQRFNRLLGPLCRHFRGTKKVRWLAAVTVLCSVLWMVVLLMATQSLTEPQYKNFIANPGIDSFLYDSPPTVYLLQLRDQLGHDDAIGRMILYIRTAIVGWQVFEIAAATLVFFGVRSVWYYIPYLFLRVTTVIGLAIFMMASIAYFALFALEGPTLTFVALLGIFGLLALYSLAVSIVTLTAFRREKDVSPQ